MDAYHTLDDCKRACQSTTGCIAIDYETVGSENCWFHSNPADLQNHYDSNTASQYILIMDPVCLGYSSCELRDKIDYKNKTYCMFMKVGLALNLI